MLAEMVTLHLMALLLAPEIFKEEQAKTLFQVELKNQLLMQVDLAPYRKQKKSGPFTGTWQR